MRARRTAGVAPAIVLMCLGLAVGACSQRVEPPPQEPSAYRVQVLADRPAAYWRLDETSGDVVFDQTANANNGALGNGVSLKAPGATTTDRDTAMVFDGMRAQIRVPSSPSLEVSTGSITLEAWIKPAAVQRGQVFVVAKGMAGVQTEYGLVLMDGVPAYQSVAELYQSTSSPVSAGVWTHLAVAIANNSAGIFYVNGAEAGTFSASTGHVVTSSNQPVMIGNEAAARGGRFAGAIDEPAIYPHALTAAQVARHVALATQRDQ